MSAATQARAESDEWGFTLALVDFLATGWVGPTPCEAVVAGFDARPDLMRRARPWGHRFDDVRLVDVLAFGAALAIAEAEAWESGDRATAARALSERRFLLGDRVLHWGVPWLVTVGASSSQWAPEAQAAVERLLALGDRHRVAPALTDLEGVVAPGHDSIGPLPDGIRPETIEGGWLFQDPAAHVGPEAYREAAELWETLASRHEGSARLWLDLAARARTSAARLAGR